MKTPTAAKRVGRPRLCPDRVLEYVVDLHLSGVPVRDIATRLNAEGVRTATGRPKWYHSYVHKLLLSIDGKKLLKTRSDEKTRASSPDEISPMNTSQVEETEKAAASCRSEKPLRPGRMKDTSPSEADVATFCSSLPQHRTTRRHGTAVATTGLRRLAGLDPPRVQDQDQLTMPHAAVPVALACISSARLSASGKGASGVEGRTPIAAPYTTITRPSVIPSAASHLSGKASRTPSGRSHRLRGVRTGICRQR